MKPASLVGIFLSLPMFACCFFLSACGNSSTSSGGGSTSTSDIITTVAGNGSAGYSGDNEGATSAELWQPYGLALDSSGNIYVADSGNERIRKVSPSGIITTVAGNGSGGYSGDNGPATSAELYDPMGVAVDASGNIYIADFNNSRVRKVTTSGVITTVAGNGSCSTTDSYGDCYSGDNGPAINAELDRPESVAVDTSGNLYIATPFNNRVRKVSTSGIITTVAGNGYCSNPTYESCNEGGYSGDNGAATSAELSEPFDVAVDKSGDLYIADLGNARIRKVGTNGIITTVAGNGTFSYSGDNGPATSAGLNQPTGIAVDASGNIFIADELNQRIRKVDTNGIITTVAGNGSGGYSGDNGPATSAELYDPINVALDASSNIYIADMRNNRIRKVTY